MFSALRRGPALLARNISTTTLSSRVLRPSLPRSTGAVRTGAPRVPTIAAFHQSAIWRQIAAEAAEEQSTHDEPVTRFADLATRGLVHPNVVNTITRQMKLEDMTDVQTRTINEALSGVDVYVHPILYYDIADTAQYCPGQDRYR
jgi:ATP-dependent RNA helicase MSS116